ncbi:PP0621 family protein [Comamonas sp. 17RB]|uniref:PP0621 family protein n=1 Tax=Comamonas sp. 17RB TaxID=3047025 RepID=UPI0024B75977|nr:PP0621 family protein [Comamonas sp. 17RB]MDI9854516.1 PP0621 family protein [Comamonas sp. 17RB]
MKYLLVIAVVAVFYLYWKKQRQSLRPPAPPSQPTLAPPQPMVACAHCGLHLPQRDALNDAQQQSYCCEAHRKLGPRP